MHKGIAVVVAFLIVTAWQFRRNTPLLLVIVATFFAVAAFYSTRWEEQSEWIVKVFAAAWLICMLSAGALVAKKLVRPLPKGPSQS
jgi:ABC-type amino acid transport system permease subunit